MPVIRQMEIKRLRTRKAKLKKLRAKYSEAKGAIEKDKIAAKVAKIAPWLTEEEFAAPLKKK